MPAKRERPLRVTVIGGGTGSFHVLSGLRDSPGMEIRSIVTMMDSGGDSGRLRDEFGVLPPGDIRRCLVALSEETALLRDLFSFRFRGAPLKGRNFGNLLFLALTQMLGSERHAVEAISRILNIRGQVIPVTYDNAHIHAVLADGTTLVGEANIDVPKHNASIPIERVYLHPAARANPDAVEAIDSSDFIVFAPGNLYTSTMPNLLVEGIPAALRRTRARVICIVNLMTRHGETDGYTASMHVAQIIRYGGRVPDATLAHRGPIPARLAKRYAAEHAFPVQVDIDALRDLGIRSVHPRRIMSTTSLVRHDPPRTAAALLRLIDELSSPAPPRPRAPRTPR